AAFLGPLLFLELVESLGQIVESLGVLGFILIVDHIDPKKFPARFLELVGIEIAQTERIVGQRFEVLVGRFFGQLTQKRDRLGVFLGGGEAFGQGNLGTAV